MRIYFRRSPLVGDFSCYILFVFLAVKWPAIVSLLMLSEVVQRFERFRLVGTAFSSDAYLTILKVYD